MSFGRNTRVVSSPAWEGEICELEPPVRSEAAQSKPVWLLSMLVVCTDVSERVGVAVRVEDRHDVPIIVVYQSHSI